ncbi:MAG: deoxynucleoside kinase [Mycoplasma sp.]|nr:deoxynucleoside kinase [Mycoplasma sp.]
MSEIKYSNSIIIGGPIAVGKSTLTSSLSKKFGWTEVPELDEKSELTNLVLNSLYTGQRLNPATIQSFFLGNRYNRYKKYANGMITTIFDRGILEDEIFAKHVMVSEPKYYEYYKTLLKSITERMFENLGRPKLYVFLEINWETFKERIFKRDRLQEITNFSKNEQYFKDLLNDYNNKFEKILDRWKIKYVRINTNDKSEEEVFKELEIILEEKGIS